MSVIALIDKRLAQVAGKAFQNNAWGRRHVEAWIQPRGLERPIVELTQALAHYADEHQRAYESPVGDDGVLGKEWLNIMRAVRGLLNGDLGRLDGGTCDGLLLDMARAAGFAEKEIE